LAKCEAILPIFHVQYKNNKIEWSIPALLFKIPHNNRAFLQYVGHTINTAFFFIIWHHFVFH